MPGENLKFADEFAAEYDHSVLHNNWNGPQFMFESVKDRIITNSKVLDLGIGTGESSRRFHEAGHTITGIDGSANMLKQCMNKKISSELVHHDLEIIPYPIENDLFDAIISNGVFHLVNPVKPIFSEVKRMLKPGGIFAFTFEDSENTEGSHEIEPGVWQLTANSGVLSFKHDNNYIKDLLRPFKFDIILKKQFLAFVNQQSNTEFYFTLMVAQLRSYSPH
jgi:predicted TPR repeat methyltransferase